ncbi:thioredoxin [Anoxybacterium hadale]|uniref:Thioredoxin n=1 Tax=Anoxybacterium hadale TaxID=3408580 RepID=A0ACD1A932_9FIRM|nr:thioredoxin [Clostridiales bacterium]
MKRRLARFFPPLLAAAGAVFMITGIYRGEIAVVLRKAINICLECIGIG